MRPTLSFLCFAGPVLALSLAACSGSPSTSDGGTGGATGGSSGGGGSSTGGGSDAGNTIPGTCTPAPGFAGNSKGIGAYCTVDGGECAAGLDCSGAEPGGSGNFCLSLGACSHDSDCGPNACCVYEDNIIYTCLPLLCAATDAGVCPS